jgi:hypothetical protein
MPAKFNTFNTGNVAMSDFLVGYTTAAAGGERRWTVQQLADSVAGIQTPGAQIQTSQFVFRNLHARQGSNPTVVWLDTPLTHQLITKTTNPFVRIQFMISTSTTDGNHPAMFRIKRTVLSGGNIVDNIVPNALGVVETGRDYTPCAASANGYTSAGGYSVGVPCYVDVIDNQMIAPAGSTVKYTLQWWAWNNNNWIMINHAWVNPAAAGSQYIPRTVSTITLTEIAS